MINPKIQDVNRISLLVDCLMHCWYDDVPNDKNNSPILSPKGGNSNTSALLTTLLNSIFRTVESYVVEAALEYSRIIFDLFYETSSISLFTTYKEFSRFNSRDIQQQSLKLLGEKFSKLNIKDSIENNGNNDDDDDNLEFIDYLKETIASHYEILKNVEQPLSSSSAAATTANTVLGDIKIKSNNSNNNQQQQQQTQQQPEQKKKKNIILIMIQSQEGIDLLKYKSNNKVIDIGKEADQLITQFNNNTKKQQQQQQQSNESSIDDPNNNKNNDIEKKFELVILKITNNNSTNSSNNKSKETFIHKKYSTNLDCIVKEIDVTNLFNAVSDLTVVQFNLSSVLVTGIPMKESSQGSTRAIYDVALLYPSHSSVNNSFNNHLFNTFNNLQNNNNSNNNNSQSSSSSSSSLDDIENKIILQDKNNFKLKSKIDNAKQQQQQQQQQPEDDENYYKNNYENISTLETRTRNEVTVKWKSNDKKINPETLPCICSHRVTPFLVSSNPSNCLLKHICSGKSVFLVTPPFDDAFTHVLTLHEKEVFLHCLHRPINIDKLAPILEHYSNDVTRYRCRDFVELLDNSIILSKHQSSKLNNSNGNDESTNDHQKPPPQKEYYHNILISNPFYDGEQQQQQPNEIDETSSQQNIPVVSPKIVEKYTRFFPWIESETLFFSPDHEELKKVLNPIKKLLLKDNLPPESLEQISKHIQQLYSHTQSNDASLFPNLKSNISIRKDHYRRVWLEFYNFSKACQVSQSHIDLFNAIEKIVVQMQIIQQPNQPNQPLIFQQQQLQLQQQQAQQQAQQQQAQQQQLLLQQQKQQLQQLQQLHQQQQSIQTNQSSSNIIQQQQPNQQKVISQTGSLYQNLQSPNKTLNPSSSGGSNNDESTLWKQFSQGKKQAKEDELKAERDRQMKNTNPQGMPVGGTINYDGSPSYNNNNDYQKKRKLQTGNIDQTSSPQTKTNNFFNNYWEQKQNNLQPQELSGRSNN